jgi:hypothetical protein
MAYTPSNPNGQATSANSAPVVIASDQSALPVDVSKDMFEHTVTAGRYNQVEISFNEVDPDLISDITVLKSNGGDASVSGGQAVFTTGSNTDGGVKVYTNSNVVYRPNSEIFAEFTTIFTTGIANSYQRIGVYDTNNGFFIGYEGTSFGVTVRKATADTTVAKASFNVDTLSGAVGSKYTRNGVPEAIDVTKDNLFRIRYGWLGAAPIVFEVFSPDGEWVLFHIVRHPNTVAATSIDNPNLPLTLDIKKNTAGASVLTLSTACWAIGTSSDLQKLSSGITDNTLVKPVRSILTAKKPNGDYINIDATTGGNLKVSVEELDPGVVIPVTDNGGSLTVDGSVTVSGTVTANAGTGTMNVSVQNASIPVTDNGGSLTVDGSVSVSNFPATQAVSGTVTVTQATAGNLNANVTVQNASIPVTDNGGSLTVDGTVASTQSGTWNINNISGTVSLPTGAATSANQSTVITALQLLDDVVATDGSAALTKLYQVGGTDGTNAQILSTNTSGHVNIADGGNSITVDGTVAATQSGTWNITNITGTVSLPTGAATAAKQPALGTAGTASADVITVQGIASMVALKVDGSAVTQPVSGTVTANAGTGTMNVSVQNASIPITDNGGSLTVDGSVSVSNFPATQAVSATNLDIRDLTATDVVTVTGGVGQTADVKITLDSEQVAISNFPATQAVSGTVTIQDGGNTITVDGTVAATQSGTWNINNISGTVSLPTGAATETTLSSLNTKVPSGLTVTSTRLLVDGSGVTQPVSGTVTVQDGGGSVTVDGSVSVSNFPATQAVSATNLDIRDLTATDVVTVTGGAGQTADVKVTLDSEQVAISNFPATQTVSGTVAATQSGTWSTRTQDGAGNAVTSRATGASRPFDVAIVDGSGNQVTSFGGGTQYTEGDIDASITGTAMLWEDTSDTLRAVSATKPLPVNIVAGSSSGTQYASGTTVATPTGTVAMGTDGVGVFALQTDDAGILLTTVTNNIAVTDNGGSLTVDGTVAATQSGTWSTRTQDGSGNAVTSHLAGSSRGLDVSIIDGSGNQVTSFGGTQYTDGDTNGSPLGTVSMGTDGTNVYALKTDAFGTLNVNSKFPEGTLDTFGKLVVTNSYNDIDVQFFRDNPNNILNVTTASGGSATSATGYAVFSSGTNTTGSVKGVSLDTTHYHSGGEVFSMFAAAFLNGGVATSFQRIGLFDDANGFYVGFENTTFGVTVRNNSSNTFISSASFNVDNLTGAASSKFTRDGTPEAIDLTKLNVFRIRFGWLGAATVKYEVLSPDDQWVLFHVIRQPNLESTPHIQTADLPMTLEITKTAGGTNIVVNTTCWGAGVNYNSGDWSNTATLGTTVGSIVDYNIGSISAVSVYIATTTTGTFDIEGTIDGKNWFRHPYVVDYNSAGQALLIQDPITPTSTSFYKMSVAGLKALRLRTTATLGTAVVVAFVGVKEEGQFHIGYSPDNIGHNIQSKSGEYTTAQAGTSLWIPATGKKICITDMTIATAGTTAGIVTVWQGSSADTTYTVGTDPVVFRGEFLPTATANPGMVKSFSVPFTTTTAGHYIRVTTSTAITVYIQLNGYEI